MTKSEAYTRELVAFIAANPGASTVDCIAELRIDRAWVWKLIKGLRDEGEIDSFGKGSANFHFTHDYYLDNQREILDQYPRGALQDPSSEIEFIRRIRLINSVWPSAA